MGLSVGKVKTTSELELQPSMVSSKYVFICGEIEDSAIRSDDSKFVGSSQIQSTFLAVFYIKCSHNALLMLPAP